MASIIPQSLLKSRYDVMNDAYEYSSGAYMQAKAEREIRMREVERGQYMDSLRQMMAMSGVSTAITGTVTVPKSERVISGSPRSLRDRLDSEMREWCGGILERV
jgi:hypothetical protein